MTAYDDFIAQKILTAPMVGIEDPAPCNPRAFAHQRDVIRWNCRMGRCADFLNTGLGKTLIGLETVRIVHEATDLDKPALIVTPLAVGKQFEDEAAVLGIEVHRPSVLLKPGINIVNYQRLHRFKDQARPVVMWLDESSILKNEDGATRNAIIEYAADVQFRYGGSATPAPNDHDELGSQSEYLGVRQHSVMRSDFFINEKGGKGKSKQQGFRLKKNAVEHFWRWVASWAALIRHPRDLGYEVDGYDLPPLVYHDHVVDFSREMAHRTLALKPGEQLPMYPMANTRTEENKVRSETVEDRCKIAVEVALSHDEPIVIWGELNPETEYCAKNIPGAKEVHGRLSVEEKEELLLGFTRGEFRVLITKPSIAGWGMNWQHCRRTVIVGASHKWEQVYQVIRRFWRFGQKGEVNVHMISSAAEGRVVENYRRKDAQAELMALEMSKLSKEIMLEQLRGQKPRLTPYNPQLDMVVPSWISA